MKHMQLLLIAQLPLMGKWPMSKVELILTVCTGRFASRLAIFVSDA